MTKKAFGELEMAILQILKQGRRMTVKEVHHLLGEENKYNTIMTVMVRLTAKKVLQREKIGLQYEYWLPAQEKAAPSFLEQIKKKLFGIKTTEMLSYLIESDQITDAEFAEMEKMIDDARNKRKTDGRVDKSGQ